MNRRIFIQGLVRVGACVAFNPYRVIFDMGGGLFLPQYDFVFDYERRHILAWDERTKRWKLGDVHAIALGAPALVVPLNILSHVKNVPCTAYRISPAERLKLEKRGLVFDSTPPFPL